jgi:hypothetical protein
MFVDIVTVLPDGTARIDFRHFHDLVQTTSLPPVPDRLAPMLSPVDASSP